MWQTFGLADGLASIQVRAVAGDRTEAMWFATANGASRYDGATFRTFTSADGLVQGDVRAVLPDRSGRIWFGTAGGVSVYDGATWTTYTINDGLVWNDVRAILQDRAGALWFATSLGASRFNGATWTSYHQTDGLAAEQVSCLLQDHAGRMWFGTEGAGVSCFDGTTWTTYNTTNSGLANGWIECIFETRDGVLWFGTRYGGLCRFDGTSWTQTLTAGNLLIDDVRGLAEDRFGRLWVAASAGVARFDGLVWRGYSTADGVVGSPTGLTIDGNGNVWVASDAGANRYDGESWTSFKDAPLGTYGALAILVARSGDVWVGTGGGGAAHYDRSGWTTLTYAPGGLASSTVSALGQDSTGALWFGTDAGVSRLDGSSWRTFTSADGLVGNNVTSVACDSSGGIWFGTTTGLSRFDGSAWRSFSSANGLPADRVLCLHVDRAGNLWCGTTGGVGRLRDTTWTHYSTADGLASNSVYAILQDHAGTMWFGTPAGLSRFDGATWHTYTTNDGLASMWVLSLAETPDSVLWVGTYSGAGISRYDGELWNTYTTADGLPDFNVHAAFVEHSGSLWFGTEQGAALYDPARVPPQTVITAPPPALSASRLQTVHFAAAFHQVLGIEFSTSLDSAPWSPWSSLDSWVGRDLPDGVHTFRVAARDLLHHVDPTPAACTFEIAATPPVPIISSPASREAVRDTMVVRGIANALRFRSYQVDLRPVGATSWDPPQATILAQSQTPVASDGILARAGTKTLPDGDYELRLSVQDTLGLTGATQVTFVVDNVPPWASQTTPAKVSALTGGDVYTTNREAHVYIPPRGLSGDAVVELDAADSSMVPATLPDGAIRVAPGFAITLTDPVSGQSVPLAKASVLDLTVAGDAARAGTRLAIYVAGKDSVWRRLGGTTDAASARIATPFSSAGRFAIFAALSGATDPGALLAPSITPRVLSSRGGFAGSGVRIGFVLSRAGNARVTIHNRAGRLVRVVLAGEPLGAGANVVSWDGRDENRHDVEAGLYFVTVEALGETRTQTLGVVR